MSQTATRYAFRDKDPDYADLAAELQGLLNGERDVIANAANTAALLFGALPDVNWLGFYFLREGLREGLRDGLRDGLCGGELVVGPFQGKPACVRIAMGKGVCGTAALQRTTVSVPDVNQFPGHIACDADSRSEIVVPLIERERLLGVLDVDSPMLSRFDEADRRGLERLAAIFVAGSDVQALSSQASRADLPSLPG